MIDHFLKEDLWALVTNLQLRDGNRRRTHHELPLSHKLLQLKFAVIHLRAIRITKITVLKQCQFLTNRIKEKTDG